MNRTLLAALGSPFSQGTRTALANAELETLGDAAFKDRVGLLLLTLQERADYSADLKERYAALAERQTLTHSVIAEVTKTLNEVVAGEFVVFKSLKPYPATPNDTDILFFCDRKGYERAYAHLLARGYLFHEWAPQQRTLYDARGAGRIGKGKKGGTYYIDLYQEVSTDYFAYLNKHNLRGEVVPRIVAGVEVPVLRAEPELAIVMFHNVFPERTFQLEHFYLLGYQLADPAFDIERFCAFAEANHMVGAIRANLALAAELHREAFGTVPEVFARLLERWGDDRRERERFRAARFATPHLFSPSRFWASFAWKLTEWYSLRTALIQLAHLADPRFFADVVRALRARLGERSVYQAE